jgi:hypothetical protein
MFHHFVVGAHDAIVFYKNARLSVVFRVKVAVTTLGRSLAPIARGVRGVIEVSLEIAAHDIPRLAFGKLTAGPLFGVFEFEPESTLSAAGFFSYYGMRRGV